MTLITATECPLLLSLIVPTLSQLSSEGTYFRIWSSLLLPWSPPAYMYQIIIYSWCYMFLIWLLKSHQTCRLRYAEMLLLYNLQPTEDQQPVTFIIHIQWHWQTRFVTTWPLGYLSAFLNTSINWNKNVHNSKPVSNLSVQR